MINKELIIENIEILEKRMSLLSNSEKPKSVKRIVEWK
jgi:hypothetical protein